MQKEDAALLDLGRKLKSAGYRFVTPTPATHARIVGRAAVSRPSLADIFGWNRNFASAALDSEYLALLDAAKVLMAEGGLFQSRVRYSSVNEHLFVHSGFPTTAANSVFFGPDTYRFLRAIRGEAQAHPDFKPRTIIDIGAGSGAGGIISAEIFAPAVPNVLLTDINPLSLRYAAINAALNDAQADMRLSDVLAAVPERADLIIANPPYLVDPAMRAYRHGGGDWGIDLSLRILREALGGLKPYGKLILYTGAPMVQIGRAHV